MKRVLSCIQPTGDLHLGNYFGAVKSWVELQGTYECFYGVVDYHSMTMPYKAKDLSANTTKMALQLLACGIAPENLFIQSLVPEHVELGWILGCVASYGELTRMTQFKDKSDQLRGSDKDAFVSGGLFYYPVLQAADILVYRAHYVPVGKDQEQHLELSRNIAARFNHQFGKEYFVHPEPLYTEVPKLLSTADPTRKMSKSLGEKHHINLFAPEERIRKQIRSAVTDTGETPSGSMSAGVANLFTLLRACGAQAEHDSLMEDFGKGQLQYSRLKDVVADVLAETLRPFRERYEALYADRKNVKRQIQESSADIRETARQTLRDVKELVGLMNVKF